MFRAPDEGRLGIVALAVAIRHGVEPEAETPVEIPD
jgi:hypothetical protein